MPMNPKLSSLAPFELILLAAAKCTVQSNTWSFLMPGEKWTEGHLAELPPHHRGSYRLIAHLN
jgi:hypothetical protein